MSAKKPKMAFKVREYSGQRVLWPADTFTREWMAAQPVESLHWVSTHRPRSPQFHRAFHLLGKFLSENVEKFTGMASHDVIKIIQLESRLHCKAMALDVPGYGRVMHLVPESINFETLDETEFRQLTDGISEYIRAAYWPEFGFN